MKGKGYNVHTWHINSTEYGTSIRSTYIVTYCYSGLCTTSLPLQLPINTTPRACQNLIRTYGIPSSQYFSDKLMEVCSHPPHENCIGTLFGRPVYHWNGPFTSATSTKHNWILVPGKGIRKVQLDEMEKMKGLQNSKYSNINYQTLAASVEQHVYAAINIAIAPTIVAPRKAPTPPPPNVYSMASPVKTAKNLTSSWTYSAPDLRVHGTFYRDRINSLKKAIKILRLDYHTTMKKGIETLQAYRLNYGPEGPKHLVILWWEWLQQH